MSEAIVRSLERNGGRALVKADVEQITLSDAGAATGVTLKDGTELRAARGVTQRLSDGEYLTQ